MGVGVGVGGGGGGGLGGLGRAEEGRLCRIRGCSGRRREKAAETRV